MGIWDVVVVDVGGAFSGEAAGAGAVDAPLEGGGEAGGGLRHAQPRGAH
mgnify:CR=1 FL=1